MQRSLKADLMQYQVFIFTLSSSIQWMSFLVPQDFKGVHLYWKHSAHWLHSRNGKELITISFDRKRPDQINSSSRPLAVPAEFPAPWDKAVHLKFYVSDILFSSEIWLAMILMSFSLLQALLNWMVGIARSWSICCAALQTGSTLERINCVLIWEWQKTCSVYYKTRTIGN